MQATTIEHEGVVYHRRSTSPYGTVIHHWVPASQMDTFDMVLYPLELICVLNEENHLYTHQPFKIDGGDNDDGTQSVWTIWVPVKLGLVINSIDDLHEDVIVTMISHDQDTGDIVWALDDRKPSHKTQEEQTVLKTNEELNKQDPQLRDVLVVIDGLNVLDVHLAGSVWAPRTTIQISGDQGLDENGRRHALISAGHYLRNTLLCGHITNEPELQDHAFVPHANIHRPNLSGDFDKAIATVRDMINRLNTSDVTVDQFSANGPSLSITVSVIDFDLTEKRILSEEAWANLEKAINEPAAPSDKLVKLMSGERKYIVR